MAAPKTRIRDEGNLDERPARTDEATDQATDEAAQVAIEMHSPAQASVPEFSDVPSLSYEAARDELTTIVAHLEGGQVPLEHGMQLWRRGEALAAHCTSWLDGAQREITGQ